MRKKYKQMRKEKRYNEVHTDYRWKCNKFSPEIRKILDTLVSAVMNGEEGMSLDAKYSKNYPNEFNKAMVWIDSFYRSGKRY